MQSIREPVPRLEEFMILSYFKIYSPQPKGQFMKSRCIEALINLFITLLMGTCGIGVGFKGIGAASTYDRAWSHVLSEARTRKLSISRSPICKAEEQAEERGRSCIL